MRSEEAEPVPLRLGTSTVGGVTRVTVGGEVDLATAPTLREALSGVLTTGALTRLVVDLGEVSFLDCSGINTLIAAHRQAQQRQIAFVVTNCKPKVLQVLEITGVTKLFTDLEGPL